jgi:drug/metabolite transporter superfamily protein YnfA
MSSPGPNDFEKASAASPEPGFFADFWDFLRHNKKWWLLPILVVLLVLALLLLLSTSAAAPFIYTLF